MSCYKRNVDTNSQRTYVGETRVILGASWDDTQNRVTVHGKSELAKCNKKVGIIIDWTADGPERKQVNKGDEYCIPGMGKIDFEAVGNRRYGIHPYCMGNQELNGGKLYCKQYICIISIHRQNFLMGQQVKTMGIDTLRHMVTVYHIIVYRHHCIDTRAYKFGEHI